MVFSDTTTNLGIVQQTRQFMRVDATQWPTANIVNSVNNYLDTVVGYAIGADKRFRWDDTNHTKLPIGTTNIVANQQDYSFLTDEQGNAILNLNRIDLLGSNGLYTELTPISPGMIDQALDEFQKTAGVPLYYTKIADNVIRLYPKPSASVTSALKFYFARTGSYFAATDTIKAPGVSPLLHRGFVINAAYDGALALGLNNLQPLGVERQLEQTKMEQYFTNREPDEPTRLLMRWRNPR